MQMQDATTMLTGHQIADWPQFLTACVLVMIRISGLMVFAPIFSSSAIATAHQGGVCDCGDDSAGTCCW